MDTVKGETIVLVTLISSIAMILTTLILCVFTFRMKELKIAEENGIVQQYNVEKREYEWKRIENYNLLKRL